MTRVTNISELSTPDPADFAIAWLLGLGTRVWPRYPADTDLPYYVVHRAAGNDNIAWYQDIATVTVDTLADHYGASHRLSNEAHRRMMILAEEPNQDVTLYAGADDETVANCDWLECTQKPVYIGDYGDTLINRFVARYRMSLTYVADQATDSSS